VRPFRLRFLGVFVFGLLSLGQAYPYSVAWAAEGQTHACCCAGMKPGTACHCHHRGKMSCHHDATPGYSSAPCGMPTDIASLDFSGQPCLPRFAAFSVLGESSDFSFSPSLFHPKFPAVPEPPPPKARFVS
jgi:hypothetical protein